jgi:hypothetical protein
VQSLLLLNQARNVLVAAALATGNEGFVMFRREGATRWCPNSELLKLV